MKTNYHSSILARLPQGYALHKIIYDTIGNPIDYEFIEVNSAYEKITGLSAESIINKPISKVLPKIKDDSFNWLNFYSDVAINQKEIEIEQFSEAFNKYFRIKAFSNANADEIQKLMLPAHGKIPKKKQRYLFEARDTNEYIERLKDSLYGKQILHFDENMSIKNIETDLNKIRTKYAKLHLRASNSASVSLYSILFLFNNEVENITNIIEGIRYKAPVSYIEELLII